MFTEIAEKLLKVEASSKGPQWPKKPSQTWKFSCPINTIWGVPMFTKTWYITVDHWNKFLSKQSRVRGEKMLLFLHPKHLSLTLSQDSTFCYTPATTFLLYTGEWFDHYSMCFCFYFLILQVWAFLEDLLCYHGIVSITHPGVCLPVFLTDSTWIPPHHVVVLFDGLSWTNLSAFTGTIFPCIQGWVLYSLASICSSLVYIEL